MWRAHRWPAVTFLPAVARGAQDPVLAVVKVDATVGGEEGVGQLARGAIEAVVPRGHQAVRVVGRVEAWGGTGVSGGRGSGGGGGSAPTYTEVAGLLGGHLAEAEGGHVTPHAEGGGQAPPGLTGAQQVSREGEDPGVRVEVRRGPGCCRAPPGTGVSPVRQVEMVPAQPGRGQRVAASAGRV